MNKNLPEAIRSLRSALGGISQVEFALNKLGVSLTMVQRFEKGKNVAPKSLAQMAMMASESGRPDLASIFVRALEEALGPEVLAVIRGGPDGAQKKRR